MVLLFCLIDQDFIFSPFIPVIIAYQHKQTSLWDSEATRSMVPIKDILGAGASVSVLVVLVKTGWGNIVCDWPWGLRMINPFLGFVSHSFEPLPTLTLICRWQHGEKQWEIFSVETNNKYCISYFSHKNASDCSAAFTPSPDQMYKDKKHLSCSCS